MKDFKQFILAELGMEEISEGDIIALYNTLQPNIDKLKTQEYRLLSLDNFNDYYGENSDLLIEIIDCGNLFEIALYKNIYLNK